MLSTTVGGWAQPCPRSQQTTADWTTDPYLRTDHAHYVTFRKLVHIRRSCSPLARSTLVWRDAQPDILGLLIYSRFYNGAEMVIIINPAMHHRNWRPFPVNYNAYSKYINLLDGYQTATITNNSPYLFFPAGFQIAAQSFMVMAQINNTL